MAAMSPLRMRPVQSIVFDVGRRLRTDGHSYSSSANTSSVLGQDAHSTRSYVSLGVAAARFRRFGFGFDDRLHVRQPLLELVAAHFFAIHDQADRLGDEIVLAGHAPGELRLVALRLDLDLDVARAFESAG